MPSKRSKKSFLVHAWRPSFKLHSDWLVLPPCACRESAPSQGRTQWLAAERHMKIKLVVKKLWILGLLAKMTSAGRKSHICCLSDGRISQSIPSMRLEMGT